MMNFSPAASNYFSGQKKHSGYHAQSPAEPLDCSAIFLMEEEYEELPHFVQEVYGLLDRKGLSFEIIIIVNGIDGFAADGITALSLDIKKIKVLCMNKRFPQSTCIQAAVRQSTGQSILACGSYQQISIEEIGSLLDSFESNIDMIIPWRQKRVDPGINQLQSRFFNWIVKTASGEKIHDLSCTVKLFRREVVEQIPLYGNMYRFLPLVASRRGYQVRELPCTHFKEYGKTGLYSMSEYFARVIDILAMLFIMGYTRKPLRFFSLIGAFVLTTGVVICTVVALQKIALGYPLGERPLLLLGLIVMTLGLQVWSAGLLGEIITFIYGRRRHEYLIETTTEHTQ